jgi:hypothetical protein
MLSRSRKSSRKIISDILSLQTHQNRSTVKVAITSKEKDRARMVIPRKTSPRHQTKRSNGKLKKEFESGVSSTNSLSKTLMNGTPKSNFWLR